MTHVTSIEANKERAAHQLTATRREARVLAAVVALWALTPAEGLAQEPGPFGGQDEKAKTGPTVEVPAEPGPARDSQAAKEGAASPQAPEAPRRRAIEEIIVTAQRREEQLQDVPISMSALDEVFLRHQGVTDLQDMARFVPNVRIDVVGNVVLPRVRGFSTNINVTRGQEAAVGLAIDEVPYGRTEYFRSGLFDVDRVEVLRGPQGQLFGANTTVGLVNLTTKDPTDEFTGFVDMELGELERRRVEAAVGGPVVPGLLNFRVAGLSEERNGFIKNTTAEIVPAVDKLVGARDRRAIRFKLDFPNLFGGALLFSYQRDEFDFGQSPVELSNLPEKFHPYIRQFDPNVDFGLNRVASLDTPTFGEANLDILVARGRYDLRGWGLNSVAAWTRLDSSQQDDSDSAPWPLTRSFVQEQGQQTTFEFRVTSPDLSGLFGFGQLLGLPLGSTDFTTGFFFQRRTQNPTNTGVDFDAPLFVLLTAVGSAPEGQGPPPPGTDGERPPPGNREGFSTLFDEESERLSGFGQMNWHFTDRWTLLYGMRLERTTKDASWIQRVDPDTAVVFPAIVDEFTDEDSRDEFQFAPKVGMTFDWTDDVNSYLTWSSNFQAGGFNNFNVSADPARRRFEPSRVRSWETGTKMRLLGGAAELNIGLFWMTMKDFQLFSVRTSEEGLPLSEVINVGELRARGVEADFTWLTTDWLTLRGALGFNDTEYLDFLFGPCLGDRPNTDGDDDPACDLTGGPLDQAPKWDINLTPSVRVPLTSVLGLVGIVPASPLGEIDLTSALSVEYVDTRFLEDSLDPRTRQPSFFLFDADIGFGSASQGWSLQFRVENLSDETVGVGSLSSTPGGAVFSTPNPPRVMLGRLRWEF